MATIYHGTSEFLFNVERNSNNCDTVLYVTGERTVAIGYARQSARDTNSIPILLQFELEVICDKVKIEFVSKWDDILILTGNIDNIKPLARKIKI